MIRFNSITFYKGELWATKGAQELGRVMVVDTETLEVTRTVTFDLGSFLENSALSVYNKQFRLFTDGNELYSVLLDVKTLPNPEYQTQVLEEDKKRRLEEDKKKKKKRIQMKEEAKKKDKDKAKDTGKAKEKDKGKQEAKKKTEDSKDKKGSGKETKEKEKDKEKPKTDKPKKAVKKMKTKKAQKEKEKSLSKEMSEIMVQAQKDLFKMEKPPIFGNREAFGSRPTFVTSFPPKNISDLSKLVSYNDPPPGYPERPSERVQRQVTRVTKMTSSKPGDIPPSKLNDWFKHNSGYDKWIPTEVIKRAKRSRREDNKNRSRDAKAIETMRDTINQELLDELAMMEYIRKKEAQGDEKFFPEFGLRGNVESIEVLKNGRSAG